MVTFLPTRPGRLADVPSFDRCIGGAESNLACALASAGHSVRWVSRVGADGFGDHLVEAIGSYGVDVTAVQRDPARPTGVYFRTAGERGTDAHEVAYYRAGSAASAMGVGNVDLAAVRAGRVLHLSGITAALSADCSGLLRELTARPGPGWPLLSFDVNYRAGLWRDAADGPGVLLELARRADLVFVGEDEAEEAWGVTGGAGAIREVLREPGMLVVKQGAKGAVAFHRSGSGSSSGSSSGSGSRSRSRSRGQSWRLGGTGERDGARPAVASETRPRPVEPTVTYEPAPAVDVVATTGAGDAFAAGFLHATLRGLPPKACLRHAHLWAAANLTTPGDLAPPPARDTADRLAAVGDDTWGRLRLGPGWTQTGRRADEEVRTP
nr:sugar kinase [Streptomyces sp. TRM68416]